MSSEREGDLSDAPDPGAAAAGEAPRESTVDALEAISTLERMLEHRHGLPDEGAPSPAASTRGRSGAADANPPAADLDGQYSIPLLDEVVMPGAGPEALGAGLPRPAHSVALSPVAERLFERLASEIDVIVQTSVDDAVKAAVKTIRTRIKQHVAIVLPEILDELRLDEASRTPRDDD